MSALDAAASLIKLTLSQVYDAAATSVVVLSGGSSLPAVSFNMTYWNSTDFPDSTEPFDMQREIETNRANRAKWEKKLAQWETWRERHWTLVKDNRVDRCGQYGNGVPIPRSLCHSQHTQLRTVDLSGSAVNDLRLMYLGRLGELATLKLNRTNITNDALVTIAGFTPVKHLEVIGTHLSEGALNDLRKQRPELEIVSRPGGPIAVSQ